MTKTSETPDIEARVRDIEEFVSEMRGGRKLLCWIFAAVGAGLGLIAAFWQHLFGGAQ